MILRSKTSTTSKSESAGNTNTQSSKKSNKRKLAVAVSEEDEEPTFKAESSKAARGPSKTKTPVVEIPIKSKNRGQQASTSGPKPVVVKEPSEELDDAFLPAETRSRKGKEKDTGPSLKGLSYATALDLPAGKPGLLANSTLKHHEMMRQDREGEDEMTGYIYVNSAGNAFKAEELLETNYSTTQAAIAYLSCVSCACDALRLPCVFEGPGKPCKKCEKGSRYCSYEFTHDRQEILANAALRSVMQSAPVIKNQLDRIKAQSIALDMARSSYDAQAQILKLELDHLSRMTSDPARVLWQLEQYSPNFKITDESVAEVAKACRWTVCPSEADARALVQEFNNGDSSKTLFFPQYEVSASNSSNNSVPQAEDSVNVETDNAGADKAGEDEAKAVEASDEADLGLKDLDQSSESASEAKAYQASSPAV
ncbi:hypothetical protein VKT23_014613 [Stygiomarasmius scandens]|uniref:Zn(2)-C6 fungal-type domain-containing protein n=1 Tax=Marasmiellus scandens TaxID=2682957 RepID=A0ABR1J2A7_9AGAR